MLEYSVLDESRSVRIVLVLDESRSFKTGTIRESNHSDSNDMARTTKISAA